ncbi:MAG: M43 family zinc metalloprotease [Chitinophagales bacterium]
MIQSIYFNLLFFALFFSCFNNETQKTQITKKTANSEIEQQITATNDSTKKVYKKGKVRKQKSSAYDAKLLKRFATASDVIVFPSDENNAGKTKYQEFLKAEGSCSDYTVYAPDEMHPEHTPVKYVRVNMHFINSPKGNMNFSEAEGKEFAKGLISSANWCLRNNKKMYLPVGNNTPVLPTRYQYVLGKHNGDDGIYFHTTDKYFICDKNNKNGQDPYSTYSRWHFNNFGVRKGEVINVFFLEHPADSLGSPTYIDKQAGIGHIKWSKVLGAFKAYKDYKAQPKAGETPIKSTIREYNRFLNHELGHSLGLSHTWSGNDGCKDTPNHPNCWNNNNPPTADCAVASNNVMDYNANQSALTPCQIGKVQYKMINDQNRRNLLWQNWCTRNPEATIVIKRGEKVAWHGAKDMEGDIMVEQGAELSIFCTISMPKDSKIIVENGGKLILDQANITNLCGDKWQGIEIWKRAIDKQKATIWIKNNGKLEQVTYNIQ